MSWLKSTVVIVVTLMLMAFASEAFADHVDWSDYIDHSAPSKPVASQSSATREAPAKVSKKRVAKKATKKKVKQARAKKHGRK